MSKPLSIIDATARYERWMENQTDVVKADLQAKHKLMRKSAFTFLRATFYRWAELFPAYFRDTAPTVVAIGDLHLENFGTWRDAEGRLIWGVNDFDEAYRLPYTSDLVRLATSVHMASKERNFQIHSRDACALLFEGYRDGLTAGGRPYVLDEDHPALREMALGGLRNPVDFWRKLRDLPRARHSIPADARAALRSLLPDARLKYIVAVRRAGAGSLGRKRFIALANWQGGVIAREIKATLPSACTIFAPKRSSSSGTFAASLIHSPNRVRDPFFQIHGRWTVRRLAPDCSKIELANLPKRSDEERLLHAMGFETANVHLANRSVGSKISADLDRRDSRWLHEAAQTMTSAILADFRDFTDLPARQSAADS